MLTIDIDQAKQRLLEMIEENANGEEIVISKNGRPIAKLVPITRQKKSRRFGSARGLIKMSDDFDKPLEDFREYK
ncbi:MAG: type II toxin-antitoxin system Phd/YefM family antitoxin [Planctomycetota bacterium]